MSSSETPEVGRVVYGPPTIDEALELRRQGITPPTVEEIKRLHELMLQPGRAVIGPQAEADRKLGAALRRVLSGHRGAAFGLTFGDATEDPRWVSIFDARSFGNWSAYGEGADDVAALEVLAAKLESNG